MSGLSHEADAVGTRIPVQHKRVTRARFFAQTYQDAITVVTVLTAGVSAIRSERTGGALALAAAELVVGAWVLAMIVSELRRLFDRVPAHATAAEESTVDVAGLAAAALGYIEVWHHAHETGHLKFVSPLMLTATTTLFLALGGRRLIERRFRNRRPHLLVTPEGATYRASRRHRWTVTWDDVASVEHGPGELTLHLRDGTARVLRTANHFNGDGLIAAACSAVATHAPARLTDATSVAAATARDLAPSRASPLSRS